MDVFRCDHESHQHFNGLVSAYHVLKEKNCYPQGCLYFHWHCVLKEKGMKCIKGYNYIGKNCKGCTYYDEEKVQYQPVLLLDKFAYQEFLDEVDDYESWLDKVKFRRESLAGRICTIKPWYKKWIDAHSSTIKFLGYLLVFKKIFIGYTLFESSVYVRISKKVMDEYQFKPKMRIEFLGEIREDKGRLIIHKPGRFECLNKGWGRIITPDEALVAIKTASPLKVQFDKCLNCRWGSLVDVIDKSERNENKYRSLYCLKNIQDPNGCYLNINRKKISRKNQE